MILALDLGVTHGGGQQVLLDFARVARRAGKEVTAIVAAGGWLEKSWNGIGHCVAVKAPTRSRSSLIWRGLRLARFSWTLYRHRALFGGARLVVVNDPELFLPAALVATLLRKDVTLYLHMAYRGLGATVLRLAAALPSVTRLVCVSHFVRRHTESLLPTSAGGKLAVIENAMPRGAEDTASDMRPGNLSRIAVVGRLVPDKGQDVVCALSRELPDAEFVLVGPFENADANYVERLRQCATGNVTLIGYQHPVIGYLRSANIGILLVPSRIAEACPLTPIEGVVAGCVVIARNLGGLAEVAHNLGLRTVDDDAGFLAAIREVQAMDGDVLSAHLLRANQRARTHYHPSRFERDVLAEFHWQ